MRSLSTCLLLALALTATAVIEPRATSASTSHHASVVAAGTSKSCDECRRKHGEKAGQRCANVCSGK